VAGRPGAAPRRARSPCRGSARRRAALVRRTVATKRRTCRGAWRGGTRQETARRSRPRTTAAAGRCRSRAPPQIGPTRPGTLARTGRRYRRSRGVVGYRASLAAAFDVILDRLFRLGEADARLLAVDLDRLDLPGRVVGQFLPRGFG